MRIAIVTDSTSDIEPQCADELGVHVVPLSVRWGGRSYRDYVELSRADFYAALARETALPATSQPAPALFEQAFAHALQRAERVMCITISSKLSGTIVAARSAAAGFEAGRIDIVDSLSVAGGLQLQVRCALASARGGASLEEVRAAVAAERSRQHVFAALPDLSHVLRTGRIGRARAAIGTLMKIVPVLSLEDGEVVAAGRVRTFARALESIVEFTVDALRGAPTPRLIVMHTDAPEPAQRVSQRLENVFGGSTRDAIEIQEAGPVVAAHGGRGAVGIFSSQGQ